MCPDNYNKLIREKKECVKNCDLDEKYQYEFNKTCYEKCPPNTKESSENKFYCEVICDENKPFEIITTQECVDYCDIEEILSEVCKLKYTYEKKEESDEVIIDQKEKKAQEIKAQDKILENIEKGITSGKLDTSNIEKGKDNKIQYGKMIITLTTTDNQKNSSNNNNNETTIDLGECENQLREAYKISKDNKLFMKKIDVIQEGMKIPKVEYDVYCKLDGINLIKLNLSYCGNSKVEISVPIKITESLDKLNSSSGYYNDICYTATSDTGTDILLSDRKKEFIKENKTVCQDGCDFTGYEHITEKAICSCQVKESSSSSEFMNIDVNEIYKNFKNIKNIANFNILICYKVLFNKKGIIKNIGFFLIIPILILHIIFIILFYIKYLNDLKNKIKEIIFGLSNWKLVKKYKKYKRKIHISNKKEIIKSGFIENNKEENSEGKIVIENLTHSNHNHKNKNKIFKIKKNIEAQEQEIKKKKKTNKKCVNIIQNDIINNNNNKKQNELNTVGNNINTEKEEIIKKVIKIMEYKEHELNELSYKLAKKYDKRKYCQYYYSLLKTKHILLFTFCNNDDYNSRIIKIDLFFIGFIIDYTINALFFNDSTMHKIYEDKGKFQFVYQLPQIVYSTILSTIFKTLLKLLALSEGNILKLKQKRKSIDINLKKEELDITRKLFIKLLFYFLTSSILMIFFLYYLSMFCAIYVNTQSHLIKDTLISFGLSLLYPFGIYLLPGIFRIPSISNRKNKKKYLYSISNMLQMI